MAVHSFVPSNMWQYYTCMEGIVICCKEEISRSLFSVLKSTLHVVYDYGDKRITISTGFCPRRTNGGWDQVFEGHKWFSGVRDSVEDDEHAGSPSCQVNYSQFGLAIYQNDHQPRRRFVEWVQNEIAVVPDFHKGILFSDEAHFWLNGYVNKQNCRIWGEANPQVYVETPLHPEKLTVWCALWAGGNLLQKR
ncbi:transposable element Tc3 transposase [Trichonephila clavipes]|nr:transposable element Tc3 transposase [Trichonephila clavipes]